MWRFCKIDDAVADPLSKRAQSGPKTAQDGPRRAEMVPRWPKMARRWPQDGPKMEPRWSQDSNKIGPSALKRCSGIAYFPGWPKIVRIGVSCRRGAIFGRERCQNCCTAAAPKPSPPQTPPTLRDRVGTTKHVRSYMLFRYFYIERERNHTHVNGRKSGP